MLKFICALLVVEDISIARHFYEQLLGQKVKADFGENVTFEGDFAIHLKSHYQQLLSETGQYPVLRKAHNAELYFETDEIETLNQRLQQAGLDFIHPLREQPWGQRVFRLYDPDGHIVEVGETMDAVICRFHAQGLSIDLICEKTFMPRELVMQALRAQGISA